MFKWSEYCLVAKFCALSTHASTHTLRTESANVDMCLKSCILALCQVASQVYTLAEVCGVCGSLCAKSCATAGAEFEEE